MPLYHLQFRHVDNRYNLHVHGVFGSPQTDSQVRYGNHNVLTLSRPMGLRHHDRDHVRHALNDHVHRYAHGYHDHHSVDGHHVDDSFHIHDYDPAGHIGLVGCYKTVQQNHDHESMTRPH